HDLLTRLVADYPDQPEYAYRLGELLNNRGIQLAPRGQPADAERWLREALAVFDRLCARVANTERPLARARGRASLGALLLTPRRPGPALEQLRAAVDGLEPLVRLVALDRDRRDILECRKELGRAYDNLGAALDRSGQPEAAMKAFREAIARLTKLSDECP